MQVKIALLLALFSFELFGNSCFHLNAQRYALREENFKSIPVGKIETKDFSLQQMDEYQGKKDELYKVIYLTSEERKGYELVLKPEGEVNAKLYHSQEAQARLLKNQVKEFVVSDNLADVSPPLKKIKNTYDKEIAEFRERVGKEFDDKNREFYEKVQRDKEAPLSDQIKFASRDRDRAIYIAQKELGEAFKLKNRLAPEIEAVVQKDKLLRQEVEKVKKELSGPVTTKNRFTIYVMAPDGKLYMSEKPKAGMFHHSSFLSGEKIASAGEMEIKNGVPTRIDLSSGHYLPENEQLDQMAYRLRRGGVDISGTKLDYKPEYTLEVPALGIKVNSVPKPTLPAQSSDEIVNDLARMGISF